MSWQKLQTVFCTLLLGACLVSSNSALASVHQGQVVFNGLPLPGAMVTASQGDHHLAAISDSQGLYSLSDLADGMWTIEIEMLCFTSIKQDVAILPNAPLARWELKLLPMAEIMAKANAPRVADEPKLNAWAATPEKPEAPKADETAADIPKPPDDSALRPSDGLLINGSSSNAATSQYALDRAFGNRHGSKSLYTGSLGLTFDNSATDAKPYALAGLNTPKAAYNRITGIFTFGGPINIPHVMRHGPDLFLAYQWTRDRNDFTQTGLVPDLAERSGDFSNERDLFGRPVQVYNPATGQPFAGNIPINPQAQALLALYPLPNIANNTSYNYQVPVISNTHQDALQMRLDKSIGRRDQFYGGFSSQSIRLSGADLFGFVDTTNTLGGTGNVNWSHRFNQRFYQTVGYKISRLRTGVTSNFQGKQNISGAAGITGNDQNPSEWGPPMLSFSSGIASLSDAVSSFDRNRSDVGSYTGTWNHRNHNMTVGGDFRRQEFNILAQQNPRGIFTFTGAATQGIVNGAQVGGSAFADFLLGRPDTSSIAFGNADKYLRQSVDDLYITDNWRLWPGLTLNIGLRWEYGAPISELKNRLVNLDIASGFAAVAPVVAGNPKGALTGERYPASLIRPDRLGIEPRLGLSWRPIAGSTLVVRAGYGIYDDTSVYEATALQLAQQSPLSTSLRVQNSADCPLSLADGFIACSGTTANTFAVDPNFRVGYAQVWQLSAQRDLPAALVGTLTYAGIRSDEHAGLPEILRLLDQLTTSRQVSGVQADTYQREVERYGGPEGIILAEDVFWADSEASVQVLQLLGDWNQMDMRWRVALLGTDRLLTDCGFDQAEKLGIVRLSRDSFSQEYPLSALSKANASELFRSERRSLEAMLLQEATSGADIYCGVLTIFKERSQRVQPIISKLRTLEEKGLLSEDLSVIASSYVHMHINRMIQSSQREHEGIIYDYLCRVYESNIVRATRDCKIIAKPNHT